MARCSGCAGDRCSCIIRNGANVTVSGAGTPTNPYVISAAAGGAGAVPPGSIVMFGGAAVPAGWTMANGSALNRVAFAALFAAIGTTFGAGDGSTTFNVPNLEQKFPVGAQGAGAFALGAQGGAASYTLTMANVPQHSHSMSHGHTAGSGSAGSHNHGGNTLATVAGDQHGHNVAQSAGSGAFAAAGTEFASFAGHTHVINTDGAHTHTITVDAFAGNTGNAGTASPTAVPTLPPYLALNFIIKT